MQRNIKFILEKKPVLDETVVLEIKPESPLSISNSKGTCILFDKKPSKNMVSGMLENLMGITLTIEQKKEIIKNNKSKLHNIFSNGQHKKYSYLPIINHLYTIEEISFPLEMTKFSSIKYEHLKRNDMGHFNGTKNYDISFLNCDAKEINTFFPFSGENGISAKLPRYYSSIIKREYCNCKGSYFLKLSLTHDMKNELIQSLDINDGAFLGDSESRVSVKIANNDSLINKIFVEYNKTTKYAAGTIGELLETEIEHWNIYEQFGLADILSHLSNENNILNDEALLNTPIDELRGKVIDIIKVYKEYTSYEPTHRDEKNTKTYFKYAPIQKSKSKEEDKHINTKFAGHIIHKMKSKANLFTVLNNIENDVLEDIIKVSQSHNIFFTKDENMFNKTYSEQYWFKVISAFIASITPHKFHYMCNSNFHVLIPSFNNFEHLFLFKKLILDNYDSSKLLQCNKNSDNMMNDIPQIKCSNLLNFFNFGEVNNDNNTFNQYINLININFLIGEIIEKCDLFKYENFISNISNCEWQTIGFNNINNIKINNNIQSLLIGKYSDSKQCISSLLLHSNIDFKSKKNKGSANRLIIALLNLIIKPSLTTLNDIKNITKFLNKNDLIVQHIVNKTLENMNKKTLEQIISLGESLNKSAYFIALDKVSKNGSKPFYEYKNDYVNKLDYLINTSRTFLDIINNIKNFFKIYKKPFLFNIEKELLFESNSWTVDEFNDVKKLLSCSMFMVNKEVSSEKNDELVEEYEEKIEE